MSLLPTSIILCAPGSAGRSLISISVEVAPFRPSHSAWSLNNPPPSAPKPAPRLAGEGLIGLATHCAFSPPLQLATLLSQARGHDAPPPAPLQRPPPLAPRFATPRSPAEAAAPGCAAQGGLGRRSRRGIPRCRWWCHWAPGSRALGLSRLVLRLPLLSQPSPPLAEGASLLSPPPPPEHN